jgi:DNA-binding transcriptional ArsR family regulator
MAYNRKNILNSKKPYRVLRQFALEEETYGKKISENLDSDKTVVAEILSNLEKIGLITESRRTRAKYYKIDYERVFELFKELWEKDLGKSPFVIEDLDIKHPINQYLIIDFEDVKKRFQEEMPIYLEKFVNSYLLEIEDSTIMKMLTSEFDEAHSEYTDFWLSQPDWLSCWFKLILIRESEKETELSEVVRNTLEHYEEI